MQCEDPGMRLRLSRDDRVVENRKLSAFFLTAPVAAATPVAIAAHVTTALVILSKRSASKDLRILGLRRSDAMRRPWHAASP